MRRVASTPPQDLVLDEEELILEQLLLNGKEVVEDADNGYVFLDEDRLLIPQKLLPEKADMPFELLVNVSISPIENAWRKGMFITQSNLVTQCEPE